MPQLVVASNNASLSYASPPVVHDLRNLLATVGLHLETLQRLSGPSGTKAADAAQALLTRGAALCNKALDCTANTDNRARRRGVDLIQVARHVADLLLASAPKNFSLDISPDASVSVFADPDELFRILFNLVSNAVAVANRKAGSLTSLALHVSREDSIVTVRLADDGPGLPPAVRRELFGAPCRRSTAPRHGYGLAIARELAERNGGTLTLVSRGKGATFTLKLPAFLSVVVPETPRWMGRRALAP
jgi:signal transduction histidine kinase